MSTIFLSLILAAVIGLSARLAFELITNKANPDDVFWGL
jgi:hypothetical protein